MLTCAAFRSNVPHAKLQLVDQVRNACLDKGFFQIINHGISEELQDAIFDQCKEFFALPLEEKMKIDLSQPHPTTIAHPYPYRNTNPTLHP